jgi:hypothetical protein
MLPGERDKPNSNRIPDGTDCRLNKLKRCAPCRYSRFSANFKYAERFDHAIPALRGNSTDTSESCVSSIFGIESIVFASLAAIASVCSPDGCWRSIRFLELCHTRQQRQRRGDLCAYQRRQPRDDAAHALFLPLKCSGYRPKWAVPPRPDPWTRQ